MLKANLSTGIGSRIDQLWNWVAIEKWALVLWFMNIIMDCCFTTLSFQLNNVRNTANGATGTAFSTCQATVLSSQNPHFVYGPQRFLCHVNNVPFCFSVSVEVTCRRADACVLLADVFAVDLRTRTCGNVMNNYIIRFLSTFFWLSGSIQTKLLFILSCCLRPKKNNCIAKQFFWRSPIDCE